jgi:hypothetical protein
LFSGSEVEITFTDGVQNLPPGTVKAARKKHAYFVLSSEMILVRN